KPANRSLNSQVTLSPILVPHKCPKLCAGSVDTNNTLEPRSARQSAVALAIVVLPTPPLPPKNTSRRSASNMKSCPKVNAPCPSECGTGGSAHTQSASAQPYSTSPGLVHPAPPKRPSS